MIAADRIRIELEPTPLLEKKLIIRRLAVGGVRLGTARSEPARDVDQNGFAATTLRSIRDWAAKYRHPVLALTPIDTIRQIVLDPAQLGTVRAAAALAASADSVRGALSRSGGGSTFEPRSILGGAGQASPGASPARLVWMGLAAP